MAAPPQKKESNTISMVVQRWAKEQTEQFSPVHRINGFPFRVRMCRYDRDVCTTLVCDKSSEAELWMCTATITYTPHEQNSRTKKHVFCSWDLNCQFEFTGRISSKVGSSVQATIAVEEDGNSWRHYPIPDSTDSYDGILVIGMEKKEIRVNKQYLASLSPYFDRLFFGNFKEKNMDKIWIGDIEYEEFYNLINVICGCFMIELIGDDENVHRVLDLADRFDLKIVEERVVNYLLSEFTSYTLVQKLLISQERNIPSLKNLSLKTSKPAEFKWMKKAPEYADFSDALKAEILDRMLDLTQKCCFG